MLMNNLASDPLTTPARASWLESCRSWWLAFQDLLQAASFRLEEGGSQSEDIERGRHVGSNLGRGPLYIE